MKRNLAKYLLISAIALMLGLQLMMVSAEPQNPENIIIQDSQRRTDFGGASTVSIDALAGNVTQISINVSTISKRWAGYYGNLTGAITLDDASNYSLYTWSGDITPQGEIFAADAAVNNFTGLQCVNLSSLYEGFGCDANPEGQCLNLTELQNKSGGAIDDGEGFNQTFTSTANIELDTHTLTGCPSTNLYANDAAQSTDWTELLLWENNTETVVYASIINASTTGFNNLDWDFQMIVGEDGDDQATSSYFFYVELV